MLDTLWAAERRDWPGYFFRIIRCSDPTVLVSLQVDSTEGTPFTMGNGEGWTHLPFRRLFFTWTAQVGQWIDVLIRGNPEEADPRRFEWFSKIDATAVTISGTTSVTQNTDPWLVAPQVDGTPLVAKTWNIKNTAAAPWQIAAGSSQLYPLFNEEMWRQAGLSFAGAAGVIASPVNISGNTTSATFQDFYWPIGVTLQIRRAMLKSNSDSGSATLAIRDAADNVIEEATAGTIGMACFEKTTMVSGLKMSIKSSSAGVGVHADLWGWEV